MEGSCNAQDAQLTSYAVSFLPPKHGFGAFGGLLVLDYPSGCYPALHSMKIPVDDFGMVIPHDE